MKKLFAILMITLTIVSVFAVDNLTLSGQATTASRYGVAGNLASTGGSIQSLLLNNNSGSAIVVGIFSAPGTNLFYSTSAYTNRVQYSTNYVTTWTDTLGNTNSYTNTFLVTAVNNVAAVTNNFYTKLLTVTVPANSTYTLAPATPMPAPQGLAVTNSAANIDYTVLWNPAQ